MTAPVDTIRNLGPAMAAAFARAGIETAQEIRQLGAEAAYARLLAAGTRPHFMAFQALVLGLQDRPFTDADPDGKTALRARFEALKAAQGPTSPIDDALAEIGVVAAPRRKGDPG
jgi:DNA transformation protein